MTKDLPKLKFFNTLTRKKEVFNPLKSGSVGLYTCGPTVYDYAHIGNLRTYVFEDLLRRTLEYAGYDVKHVMNITDVGHLTSDSDEGEDKMELGARRESKSVWEIAEFYTRHFLQDTELLHIKPPSMLCKATDHIKEMIKLVEKLEEKGYTYQIEDGIYFNTAKLKGYGKLARLKKEGLKAGARVEMVEGKKNPTDFALWKLSKEKRQMEWNSPWGKGFPGWHIECSAMAMKYLGQTFDIHCGGIDHVPVHHTNEIAQSEAATGRKFVNYWLHGEFMLVDGKKMSKSLGNYYRLQDLIEKGFDPVAFRYLIISTHYRSQLNFTLESLQDAQKTLQSINDFIQRLDEAAVKGTKEETLAVLEQAASDVERHLYDDLNTPEAISALFSIMHTVNRLLDRKELDRESLTFVRNFMKKINGVFQFLKPKEKLADVEKKLIEDREQARKKGDFKKADFIREKLKERGIIIEDTPKGTRWKKT